MKFGSLNSPDYRAKKKNTLFSGNASDKKYPHPSGCKLAFLINLIEFVKYSLHLKNYSKGTFICWKTRCIAFKCSKRNRRQFLRTNLLVANRHKDEFYWPNFFHYRFKIQSQTWTLHSRSQHLQQGDS